MKPEYESWGIMLNDGFAVLRAQPHVVIFPALVIAVIMIAFLFLGDGLRDALDPRA
jgi:oligopeptide transport system permease protein